MDEKLYENVITLHAKNAQTISNYVCNEILSNSSAPEEPSSFSYVLVACNSDVVGGELALQADEHNQHLPVDNTEFPQFTAKLIERACSGSIVLTVLEDFFQDARSNKRPLEIVSFAELIDVNVRNVIDRNGVRWEIMPGVDVIKLSTSSWKRLASVSTSPTDASSSSNFNVAQAVAQCLRAVAATTYAALSVEEDIVKAVWSLPVVLCQTNVAASQALVALSVYAQNISEELRSNSATLHLPCGSDVSVEVRLSEEQKGDNNVVFGLKAAKTKNRPSPGFDVVLTIMATVLMGAGFQAEANIDPEEWAAEMVGIDRELAGILWAQAAVISQGAAQETYSVDSESISDLLQLHNLARNITIYRVANWIASRSVPYTPCVDEERLLYARIEAVDILEKISLNGIETFLGEESSETGSLAENTSSSLPAASTETPACVKALRLTDRTEFLHHGPGNSNLPLLDHDFTSRSGLIVCARRGIPIRPDSRRSIMIRKRSALWGRVVHESGCFKARPLVNAKAVLRALIPIQKLGVAGISFGQFESGSLDNARGNELANILLSGAYGADQALWALKKILYSGVGAQQDFVPSYLLPLKDRVRDDGFALSAILGSDAVAALEVIVDDEGRVILDYEGDFKPLELKLDGRKIQCIEIDEYSGGKVGTIVNKACIF